MDGKPFVYYSNKGFINTVVEYIKMRIFGYVKINKEVSVG